MTVVRRAPVFEVAAGTATDPGLVRSHNEDAFLAERPIFLVADGMGGHERGEVASASAVQQFAALAGRPWVFAQDLRERATAAASVIAGLAAGRHAPGTTVAGVGLTHESGRPSWLPFNLGDSRVYLLREGELAQISVDHSRRQEMLDAGADPATVTVGRNIITRALGAGLRGKPRVDVWLMPAAPGDRVLICSDGLSGELTELLIAATLRANPDPGRAADALVRAALAAAGRDNVTAVVVDAVHVHGAADVGEVAGEADGNLTDPDPDTQTDRDDTIDLSRQEWRDNREEAESRAGALDARQ